MELLSGALQRHSTNGPALKALATMTHWPGGPERLAQGRGGSQQVLWRPVSREGTCLLTGGQAPAPSARASLPQSLVAPWLTGERSCSRVGVRCHGLVPSPSRRVSETPAEALPVLRVRKAAVAAAVRLPPSGLCVWVRQSPPRPGSSEP